jgi:sugar lactone lactonase YvrE
MAAGPACGSGYSYILHEFDTTISSHWEDFMRSVLSRSGIALFVFVTAVPARAQVGSIRTLMGGPASVATLRKPLAAVMDAAGNLYVADTGSHRVLKLSAETGHTSFVAGIGVPGYGGDGGPATAALLNSPSGLALDGAGGLYIADQNNHRVRRVDPAGRIATVAGTGNAYFSGDGGPATAANLWLPESVAVDGSGALFIADYFNARVRRVDPRTGMIATVAGNGTVPHNGEDLPATRAGLDPHGIALDAMGNLYVADRANERVRRVDAASGTIRTVAGMGTAGFAGDGGPARAARLNAPMGVILDAMGNRYIADSGNHRVRRVSRDGVIITVAGNGEPFFSGDGSTATAVSLWNPSGLGLDPLGNLLIADTWNDRIRLVGTVAVP